MDPGFVLDEASGLYYHASSGFYHDPSAGWYYNTHDGVYYKFEEETYVPIAAENCVARVSGSEECLDFSSTGSLTRGETKTGEFKSHKSCPSGVSDCIPNGPSETDCAGEILEEHDQSARETGNGHVVNIQEDASSSEIEFPLWYFDTLRSIYWYFDKESRAYYKYHDDHHNLMNGTVKEANTATNPEFVQLDGTGAVHGAGELSNAPLETSTRQEISEDASDVDNFEPKSGWVEEALIDLYLKGYPREAVEKDNGPWITSADIFTESSPNRGFDVDSRYWERADNLNNWGPDEDLSYPGYNFRLQRVPTSIDESDNEGSEELEEGEWVPDEPLRLVDGNPLLEEYQLHTRIALNEGRQIWESTSLERNGCNGNPAVDFEVSEVEKAGMINGEIEDGEIEDGEIEDGEIEDGEIEDGESDGGERGREIELDNGGVMSSEGVELLSEEHQNGNLDDSQRLVEEQWHAQFGQVVRERAREHVIPGAIDLWDWMIAEMEPNSLKSGRVVKKLVGRIASSVTKLISASSGLIRTSAIRAAELDFVKVSSGKIYRLRRPSLKHVRSVGNYDSSNPTKDWGFPVFELLGPNIVEGEASVFKTTEKSLAERRTEPLVSKPFVPNTDHWQFQRLISAGTGKKGKSLPAALLASKYLSPEEIQMNEQRKQKYRDRAAERRTLHRGFGVGPGQKGLTPHEQDKFDADQAVEIKGALKNAAAAPRLGSDNVGKRMLEGMGWKEGQTLGVEGGLVNPVQAKGNEGRAGLGWR